VKKRLHLLGTRSSGWSSRFALFSVAFVALIVASASNIPSRVTAQTSLSAREMRGKQIYFRGTSPSGKEILAYVGDSSLEAPASNFPCVNCHGSDGLGKPEGGVTPSNISWDALTKVYGVKHPNGRQHPAYTPRGLELAITRGIDPGGNKLQTVMPRYVLSPQDLADLVVYLERLGKYVEPGISESKITIGTLVPSKGALVEMGQVTTTVIKAFFDELNSQGGIYSRRLELKVIETAETPERTRANVERLINDEQVFAMTGAFIAGYEKEIAPLMAEKEVPLIGPMTLYPQTGFPLNRQVFYLLSGAEEQASALLDFIRQNAKFNNKSIVFAYARNDLNARMVAAMNERSKKNGLRSPQTFAYEPGRFDAPALAKQFQQARHDIVFLLASSEEVASFLKEAATLAWYPFVFLPGTVGALDLYQAPPGFNGKVFMSFPTSPTDHTEAGLKEFRALASKYNFPSQHRVAQVSAYTAAKILVEALKRAGRNLTREELIKALEGFYEYSTGLTPAITYGPNRRIGAMGAYVVTVDLEKKQFSSASGWISIN
jgi:ABC-type branched-subunit amino acid transport system substrate-binding protein